MLFLPFDNPTRNNSRIPEKNGLTFGFLVLFIVSLIFLVLCQSVVNGLNLANIPSRTFGQLQFYRLFTAPLATLDGFLGILSIIISFWWLVGIMPIYERKFSTVHLLTQVVLQNLLVQICYSITANIMIEGGAILQTYNNFLFNLGWYPIIIIWIFKFGSDEPQKLVNFCFLPFNIRKKNLPWVCAIFIIFLSHQRSALVVATLLGFTQSLILGGSFIRLPMAIYRFFQLFYPNCIKESNCFVTISDAENDMKSLKKFKGSTSIQKNKQQPDDSGKTPKTIEIQRLRDQLTKAHLKINKRQSEEQFNMQEELKPEQSEDKAAVNNLLG